jgi:hypothetical protein
MRGFGKMKAIVCEACHSNDLVLTKGFLVCQHCDSKYTPDKNSLSSIHTSGNSQQHETDDDYDFMGDGEILREIAAQATLFTGGILYVFYNRLVFLCNDESKNFYFMFDLISHLKCSFFNTLDIVMVNGEEYSYAIGNKAVTNEWIAFINNLRQNI